MLQSLQNVDVKIRGGVMCVCLGSSQTVTTTISTVLTPAKCALCVHINIMYDAIHLGGRKHARLLTQLLTAYQHRANKQVS